MHAPHRKRVGSLEDFRTALRTRKQREQVATAYQRNPDNASMLDDIVKCCGPDADTQIGTDQLQRVQAINIEKRTPPWLQTDLPSR